MAKHPTTRWACHNEMSWSRRPSIIARRCAKERLGGTTGLQRLGLEISAQISPRWGQWDNSHICYLREFNLTATVTTKYWARIPLGASRLVDAIPTQSTAISIQWGLLPSVSNKVGCIWKCTDAQVHKHDQVIAAPSDQLGQLKIL